MVEVVTSATTELDSVVAEGETGDESIEVIGKYVCPFWHAVGA